jgi:general stress protein 26
MDVPITTLDARFSESRAVPAPWEETQRSLETAELFWIATVRADGRPHVTPLVATWLDDSVHFCTGIDEQKAVNLRHNDHVSLLTGCNGWEGGVDVVVEGVALQQKDDRELERLAASWTTKWDGSWQYEVRSGSFFHAGSDEPVLVFSVRPRKVLAFAKGPFGQTTHRFR